MNKLTPEQRVIKILKDRLPIDMHHYQYQELAEEILTAHTEPENLTLDVDKGDKTPRNGADCQAHTEPEDEHWVKVPYCNKCGGEHLTEEHATEPEDEGFDGICSRCGYDERLQQEDKNE